MNLANDLLRKNNGHTRQVPEPTANNHTIKPFEKKKAFRKTGKYFDERGNPELAINIAKKYKTNEKKVRDAFKNRTISEAYEYLSTDQRVNNGQSGVYFLPDGTGCTAKQVGNFYGIGKFIVQDAWRKFDKCPIKANEYLMNLYFHSRK